MSMGGKSAQSLAEIAPLRFPARQESGVRMEPGHNPAMTDSSLHV